MKQKKYDNGKAFRNKWKIYKEICRKPQSEYELSETTGLSLKKINYYVKKLLKEGLIKKSTETINGIVNNKYSPKKVGELINWEKMTNTKKLDL